MQQVVHENKPLSSMERYFTTETGALTQGYGMCFDRNYVTTETGQTATDDWGKRDKVVELPDNTNNLTFAGVLKQDYDARANGGWVVLYKPGSTCVIYVDGNVTIAGYVTCIAGASNNGQFDADFAGFPGRGMAQVIQTRTGAGLVLAYLCDGEESGLVETIQAVDNTAVEAMPGGYTLITGAITIGTGDSTHALADGLWQGFRKGFKLIGALTTNDYLVTLDTTGEQLNGTTDVDTLEFDGAADETTLEWRGHTWRVTQNKGTALA